MKIIRDYNDINGERPMEGIDYYLDFNPNSPKRTVKVLKSHDLVCCVFDYEKNKNIEVESARLTEITIKTYTS